MKQQLDEFEHIEDCPMLKVGRDVPCNCHFATPTTKECIYPFGKDFGISVCPKTKECEHEWCEGNVPICKKCFIPKFVPTPKPEWREKLAELSEKYCKHDEEGGCLYHIFEPFISKTLSQERQAVLEEVGERIVEMQNDKSRFCNCSKDRCGYNQALSEIKQTLKKL